MRIFAVLVVWSPLLAQGVSAGLRSGVLATPLLTAESPQQAGFSRFTIGPTIELHLWRGAALGADFLLRRTDLGFSPAGLHRAEIREWELPGTLIYRFRRPTGPFVRTGMSFNRVYEISGATECGRGPFGERFYCVDGSMAGELRHRGTSGFVLGGGFRWRLHKLRLEPEVRLTHWTDRNFGVRDSAVRSDLNQIGFLIGVLL